MYELSRQPQAVSLLREEQRRILGRRKGSQNEDLIDANVLHEMEYGLHFIYEVFRLHMPIARIFKDVKETIELEVMRGQKECEMFPWRF